MWWGRSMTARRSCQVAIAVVVTLGALCGVAAAEDDLCAHGSGDAAIADCTRAIESGQFTGQELAVKFSNRGVEWRIKQDYARAISDYDEAIRLDPDYADAYYNRCVAYNRQKKYELALADCSKAIELGPSANALNATGEEKLSNDRSSSDYFTQRGIAYRARQEINRAIADYSEALRLYPRNVAALGNRARAYEAKGDSKRAKADRDAARRLAR
jgi:tetratricopeptide (TPR) repeat protein